jgi:acyl-CoA thioesterase-1
MQRFIIATLLLCISTAEAAAETIRIVALGDSLTAGFGLAAEQAFPARLEARLKERGHDVEVINAGLSGDTTKGGLERLDWSVPEDADAVIVELGANDALRAVDPQETRANLSRMLERLSERGIPVLLAGMRAPPNLGAEYAAEFDPIFPELAAEHGAILYPFFLGGVAAQRHLNQGDGMHPNAAGVEKIVDLIIAPVEQLIAAARNARNRR